MIAGHSIILPSDFSSFGDFLFGVMLCMWRGVIYVGQHAAREGTSDQHL
jgi:hypothetical protein